jgi:hypothetical protein
VLRKFFPLDKNYLLEEVQLQLQEALLAQLFQRVKSAYEQLHNPLGLKDSFSLKIQSYEPSNLQSLQTFYQNLAGVYRYKWGDSQLEFVWDGRDNGEKYREDWCLFFERCVSQFCQQELFIQAVLDVTVFLPKENPDEKIEKHLTMAENRMNHFMLQHFEVKLHKSKGLVAMKVA